MLGTPMYGQVALLSGLGRFGDSPNDRDTASFRTMSMGVEIVGHTTGGGTGPLPDTEVTTLSAPTIGVGISLGTLALYAAGAYLAYRLFLKR